MSRMFLSVLVLAGLTLAAWAAEPAPAKDPGAARSALLARQRQVNLALAATREKLLKEDDELRDLNEQLQRLQQKLLKALEARPDMADLRRQADAVASDLNALDQRAADTPAK